MTVPETTSSAPLRTLAVPPVVVPPPTLLYHNPTAHAPPPGWTNVSVHPLKEAGRRAAIFRIVGARFARQLIIDALVVAFLSWQMRGESFDALYVTLLVLFLGGALCVSAFLRTMQSRKQFGTFYLLVSDQGVQRCLDGYPRLSIPFSEITQARRFARGVLLRTAQRTRMLTIPALLEDYEGVVERVSLHVPVQPAPRRLLRTAGAQALIFLMAILYLGAYFIAMESSRLGVEIPLFLLVLGFDVFVTISLLRSPHFGLRSKITTPATMGFMLVLLILKMLLPLLLHI